MSNILDVKSASEKLHKIISEQKNNINSSKESITNSSEQQRQPDDIDAASGNIELQLATAHMQRASATITKCTDALERIRIGEFGLCCSCWDDIEPQRLNVTPYLDMCASCSQIVEVKKKSIL